MTYLRKLTAAEFALTFFDLINALLRPQGLQLRHMWRESSRRLSFRKHGQDEYLYLASDVHLAPGLLFPKYLYYLLPGQERQVRGADGSLRKEVLVADVKDFERRWEKAVDSLERAIGILHAKWSLEQSSRSICLMFQILPAFASAPDRSPPVTCTPTA